MRGVCVDGQYGTVVGVSPANTFLVSERERERISISQVTLVCFSVGLSHANFAIIIVTLSNATRNPV